MEPVLGEVDSLLEAAPASEEMPLTERAAAAEAILALRRLRVRPRPPSLPGSPVAGAPPVSPAPAVAAACAPLGDQPARVPTKSPPRALLARAGGTMCGQNLIDTYHQVRHPRPVMALTVHCTKHYC